MHPIPPPSDSTLLAEPSSEGTEGVRASKPKRERTCVGCGEVDSPDYEPVDGAPKFREPSLVRVVLLESDGAWECVVDAPGNLAGRGAWLHAAPKCLQRACKSGFSKAFKAKVDLPIATLASAGIAAGERRVEGLLASARRGRIAAFGHDAARELLAKEPDALLLVATDAGAVARSREVEDAVRLGRGVAWATKRRLGVFFGKEEVALVAIADPRMSMAIVRAVADRAAFAACSVDPKGAVTSPTSRVVDDLKGPETLVNSTNG